MCAATAREKNAAKWSLTRSPSCNRPLSLHCGQSHSHCTLDPNDRGTGLPDVLVVDCHCQPVSPTLQYIPTTHIHYIVLMAIVPGEPRLPIVLWQRRSLGNCTCTRVVQFWATCTRTCTWTHSTCRHVDISANLLKLKLNKFTYFSEWSVPVRLQSFTVLFA